MRRNQKTSPKSVLILFGAVVSLASGSTIAATNGQVIIANSTAMDSATRQITRTVASESLKTISTKDKEANSGEGLVVERLEDDGPIVLPPKIVTEPSPGSRDSHVNEDREPAAEAPAPKIPAKTSEAESVTADKALTWLQNGNKRYLKKANRADGKTQVDRDRLVKGQRPHAIVLSCSDSRVPPETVFDQSLGELFVVRTVGESIDAAVLASLEYAVENLGPRLLVVMGHTSCEAVSNAVAWKNGDHAMSPSLEALAADIKNRLPNRGPATAASKSVEIESAANAQGVAADLMARSKIIRERVEKGDLLIKPALYYLDSGTVKFY